MFKSSNKPSPIDSLIGAGTVINGDINFTGGLRIDGTIKGNIKAAGDKPGTLVLSELAKVEGEIECSGLVSIRSSAEVSGSIKSARLVIYPGAIVEMKASSQES